MGSSRSRSTTPDLFSTASATVPLLPSVNPPPSATTDRGAAVASPFYTLPTNLPNALRHPDDDQLEQLLTAAHAEQQARGGKMRPNSDEPRASSEPVAAPLAQGKLNAIRAAFKAGVRPPKH